MNKICSSCKETKALGDFPPNKATVDGLNRKCRLCYNAYMRDWYSKNTEKHKERMRKSRNVPRDRAKKYGLTVEQVDAMLEEHNGLCHSCLSKPAAVIDHCHETNAVRGMLCQECNLGIGLLGDDLESVQKAVEYLSRVVRTV